MGTGHERGAKTTRFTRERDGPQRTATCSPSRANERDFVGRWRGPRKPLRPGCAIRGSHSKAAEDLTGSEATTTKFGASHHHLRELCRGIRVRCAFAPYYSSVGYRDKFGQREPGSGTCRRLNVITAKAGARNDLPCFQPSKPGEKPWPRARENRTVKYASRRLKSRKRTLHNRA